MKLRKLFVGVAIVLSINAAAQDKVVRNIIEMSRTDNQTMTWNDFLANRIGGRPVGSHNLQDAEAWVAEKFKSWGLEVMVQEVGEINVGFSRGPWSGKMLSEDGMILHFCTPTYTSGTKGPQKGPVVIEPKTQRELDANRARLKGAWVLTTAETRGFAIDPADTAHFFREMIDAGVLGFIQKAPLPIQCHYDRANCYNLTMETLPEWCDIHLDADQFDIIWAKAQKRDDFELEFDIRNHFFRGPVKYNNVIGIMKGSKHPDEYVLAGGHLDSYDVASGAVDDGNGVAVTMEAARILALSGAKPERTILFCIWTAEEYGLYGSKYFVENNTVPLDKISNYINRDGGPTVPTGINVPAAMFDDFKKICEPIENLNPDFPFVVSQRKGEPGPRPTSAGGSDHAYFAMNGVPTQSFSLTDPKGYGFEYRQIWHTDKDLYYQVIPEYMDHSSVVTAITLYGLANLKHLLSRDELYSD